MKDLLTLDEVAQIANVSKPTIYRRVKHNGFPKPIKVPRTGDRGPKTVNRWERGQVMGWLMKGNDPQWMKQPIKDIQETVKTVDEAPKDYDLAESIIWSEPEPADHEPRGFWNNHVLLALIGGVAAAAAYALVNG
jgi:predicted DNA-binding transcriptional regulator AlpA